MSEDPRPVYETAPNGHKWSSKERLSIVADLAAMAQGAIRDGEHARAFHLMDTAKMTAMASRRFLDTNRERILSDAGRTPAGGERKERKE